MWEENLHVGRKWETMNFLGVVYYYFVAVLTLSFTNRSSSESSLGFLTWCSHIQ